MMTKLIIILVIGLFCEAIGVVVLNKGIKQIGDMRQVSVSEVVRLVKAGVTNTNILTGIFFEAIFFVTLLILMSKGDVSFIWPLTALGFVITTMAAKFYLHEEVSGLRWAGVALIMLGAGLITWSEKMKERQSKFPPTQSSTATNAAPQQ
jgi:drug/metabolite transporter (DMT)-like permease